jgi:hypothetical protein
MKQGLILFFVGAVLAGVNLGVMGNMAKKEKKMGWTPQLVTANTLMIIFVLAMLAGVIIVFMHKWWLALILLFVVLPFVVQVFSGEKS